ncbi:MAG: hypothetical protein OEY10_00245 [Nitrosopumilus sp.]|nr:hypothetical protein [Nitrosopumilus sp.]
MENEQEPNICPECGKKVRGSWDERKYASYHQARYASYECDCGAKWYCSFLWNRKKHREDD